MRLRDAVFAVVWALCLMAVAMPAWADGPMDGLPAAPSLDRGSPKRAYEGFLHAGSRGDFDEAAHYLDLRSIARARQATDGPVVAQKLWYVMTHVGHFDVSKISDDPDIAIPKGETTLEVGSLDVRDGPVPFAMMRVKFPDGVDRWIVAKTTVAVAGTLYAAIGKPSFGDRLPTWMQASAMGNEIWQWLALVALVPLAYLLARIAAWLVIHLLALVARRTPSKIDDALVLGLRQPLQLVLTALLIDFAVAPLQLTSEVQDFFSHVAFTLLVIAGSWATIRSITVVARELEAGMSSAPEAEMERRRVRTRLAIFQRVAIVLVTIVSIALMLLQFERVRTVGVSLLASAGLAGIVLGFGAQRSLGAIVSGIQLSITQPIRIGDAVVIEGEFGTIESIHLTQVIVALWDERRMVLPVSRFLEQPFQNWSKAADKLVGTVMLSCDYTAPVALLRAELRRICEASINWDKRDCGLQVTDVTDRSITVRALVSAPTPGALWDLRCEVREKLLDYVLHLDGGRFLPRTRFDSASPPPASGPSPVAPPNLGSMPRPRS